MRATQFIWRAMGSPAPVETDGTPIAPRGDTGRCAGCGEPAQFKMRDAISDSFTTVKNRARSWPFGGDSLCAACVWCCKAMALRAGLWFARENGIWFIPSRPIAGMPSRRLDPLEGILSPPEPPFVAGYPLYGIDHGTEANCARILWPGCQMPPDPLIKCQSKHTAIYAQVSYSRERYRLQVDDVGDYMVDVPLWTRLRAHVEPMLAELRAHGVGAVDARDGLTFARLPARSPVPIARVWPAFAREIRPYYGAPWWPLFINLLPMPELTKGAKQ